MFRDAGGVANGCGATASSVRSGGRNRTSISGSKGPRLAVRRPRTARRLSRRRPRHDEGPGNRLAPAGRRAPMWRASATTVGPLPLMIAPSAPASRNARFASAISGCLRGDRLLQIVEQRVPQQIDVPGLGRRDERAGIGPDRPPSSSHHRYASGERVGNPNGLTTHHVVDQRGPERCARPARASSPVRPRASPARRSRSARRSTASVSRSRPHAPQLVQREQRRGRVGAAAAEPGRDRDALLDLDLARRGSAAARLRHRERGDERQVHAAGGQALGRARPATSTITSSFSRLRRRSRGRRARAGAPGSPARGSRPRARRGPGGTRSSSRGLARTTDRGVRRHGSASAIRANSASDEPLGAGARVDAAAPRGGRPRARVHAQPATAFRIVLRRSANPASTTRQQRVRVRRRRAARRPLQPHEDRRHLRARPEHVGGTRRTTLARRPVRHPDAHRAVRSSPGPADQPLAHLALHHHHVRVDRRRALEHGR